MEYQTLISKNDNLSFDTLHAFFFAHFSRLTGVKTLGYILGVQTRTIAILPRSPAK